jgi:hypothetical protein
MFINNQAEANTGSDLEDVIFCFGILK